MTLQLENVEKNLPLQLRSSVAYEGSYLPYQKKSSLNGINQVIFQIFQPPNDLYLEFPGQKISA